MGITKYMEHGPYSEMKEMNEKKGMCEEDESRPIKGAVVTLIAFIVAGIIPIMPYIFFMNSDNAFLFASIFTGMALFGVGGEGAGF